MFSSTARTSAASASTIARLRDQIARIERTAAPMEAPWAAKAIPFGVAAIDSALSCGGLTRGALHEAAGAGPDTEHGAAAALFLGGILARMDGPVLWIQQQPDLFAPGLACVGLLPARLLIAEAGKNVLAAMEEGLAHPGLAAVVGEFSGRLSLIASRRLQLAAGQSGVMAALLRRAQVFDDPELGAPSAAVTRWRISALPSPPLTAGWGPASWRLELVRCRGGEPGSWIVEACDAAGRLTLSANLGHGPVEETRRVA